MTGEEITKSVERTRRKNKLEWYEQEIEKAGKTLGRLFRELRDDKDKPYLLAHDTFEHYCEDRWNMTPGRARQLMAAESVRSLLLETDLAPVVAKMPERQLRELAPVAPERRAEVLRAAGPKPTAKAIKQARAVVIDGETGAPVSRTKCPHCSGTGWVHEK